MNNIEKKVTSLEPSKKLYRWYEIKEKGIVAYATIPPLGNCKIMFEGLSSQNTVYFGGIGYKEVKEIAKILNKIADMGKEEWKKYNKKLI